MYKYLPSKKFSIFLISIVIVLLLIYIYSFFTNKNKKNSPVIQNEKTTTLREVLSVDSDNDGLIDWEESLWKTDIKKVDTDGDGTSDGAEVKANRDPLKASTSTVGNEPNDKLEQNVIDAREKVKLSTSTKKLSATENMGRQLLTSYLNTKKLDVDLSESEIQNIIQAILNNLPEITFKAYEEKDIIVSQSSDNESLRIYTNNIAKIILDNLKIETESIDDIIADAAEINTDTNLDEQIKEIFKRFDPLINKNKKSVDDLLKISVPKILLAEHLNLLNSFQGIYQSLELMQKSSDDTVILVLAKNNYPDITKNLVDTILDMTKKLSSLKIRFLSEKDYGYQFFNVIILKE